MTSKRAIGVVTVGRSDYGIYRSVLRQLSADARFELRIFAGGMHLSARHGETWREIERDGIALSARAVTSEVDGSAASIAAAMSAGLGSFAAIYARQRPDLLLVLGDRYEMFAAAAASVPFRIPLVHIHGGETTEGAMDEVFRHALTKMSHLHFVSTAAHAARVVQMGEAPWRVTVSGAPALDGLAEFQPLPIAELSTRVGLDVSRPTLLVTYHPATLAQQSPCDQIAEVLAALRTWPGRILFTGVNADTGHTDVRTAIETFARAHAATRVVENLGREGYFSLMRYAAAMVGNSSSGLIEAPSFELPVVNIGPRQQGRTRAANVLDVPCAAHSIAAAIHRATTLEFRGTLRSLKNPYGNGNAAARIAERLASVELGEKLLMKTFHDLPGAA